MTVLHQLEKQNYCAKDSAASSISAEVFNLEQNNKFFQFLYENIWRIRPVSKILIFEKMVAFWKKKQFS